MTGIERRPMSPEAILADGCAPVIMGAKPSNLVSFDSSAAGFSAGWLLDSRAQFACSGIASYELRRTDARTLVLFYRPCMLSLCLGEPQSGALLVANGVIAMGEPDDNAAQQCRDLGKALVG